MYLRFVNALGCWVLRLGFSLGTLLLSSCYLGFEMVLGRFGAQLQDAVPVEG